MEYELDEIIGMECSHLWRGDNWNIQNSIRCEVLGVLFSVDALGCLMVAVQLEPIKTSKAWDDEHKDEEDSEIMCMRYNGRSIDSILFD